MKPIIAVPAIALLLLRAYRRKSLTTAGLIVAGLTATVHALHPSALAFTLLGVFFLMGTQATRVKHDIKAGLTLSASGHAGGEGPRNSTQVLANSAAASILCLVHVLRYGIGTALPNYGQDHFSDLVLVGIICNYVSVTADTLSSELGILSPAPPRLITNPLRTVPRGTNGGVTVGGIWYGYVGSLVIALTSLFFIPFSSSPNSTHYTVQYKILFVLALSIWGAVGSLLDSLLGALLQASVIDRRTGKIVEAPGGIKVLTEATAASSEPSSSSSSPSPSPSSATTTTTTSTSTSTPSKPAILRDTKTGKEVELKPKPQHERQHSRQINTGRNILDNNQVNFLMASTMTIWGMAIAAGLWGVDLDGLLSTAAL